MPDLYQQFPPFYRELLPDIMLKSVPKEGKANCSNCSMVQKDPSLGSAQKHLFRPDTKCCTFHPQLPNYLVGGLLQDSRPEMAEGRRRMQERIEARSGVTPWWIGPSRLDQHLYEHARSSFGKATRLRCPYYATDSGHCTIWAWREAVCSTWYCKYEAGKDGLTFYVGLKNYIGVVEKQLSRYAMMTIDPEFIFDDQAAAFYKQEGLTQDQLDEQPPEHELYKKLWRQFEGREASFYQQCYEIITALTSQDVERLMGLDGTIRNLEVQRQHEKAQTKDLPDRLVFNPQVTVRWLESGEVALSAYSEYDALALPGAVYPLLVAFDGRQSTSATRQKLRQEHEADLADEVLMMLYRYRILDQV
ncbi:MAG TPA: hypothetical protein VE954_10375 [Oligoflexus sp.]|uniref:hypothetical protein n=1 Tax=Oligoflexus sp. TaxID=1971216 RepID=UPI002D50C021|nr:hypothetical protein [Oligoflexus sp.]HYX33509.1 hypothetical protein [Oligoflexus sp.]